MSDFGEISYGIIQTQINGVDYNALPEYTSSEVVGFYGFFISVFGDVFNENGLEFNETSKEFEYPAGKTPAEAIEDAVDNLTTVKNYKDFFTQDPQTLEERFEQSINNLITLAKDGLEGFGLQGINRPLLTADMAGAVDQLIRSFKAAGIEFDSNNNLIGTPPVITREYILNWRNLAQNSNAIRQILFDISQSTQAADKTLQSLIELIYVKTGNEILASNLDQLESALGTTKGALETLNKLQALHNKVAPEDKERDITWLDNAIYGVRPSMIATYFATGRGPEGYSSTQPVFTVEAEEYFTGINPTLPSGNHPAFVAEGVRNFFDNNSTIGEDFTNIYNEIANLISNLSKEESQFLDGKIPSVFSTSFVEGGSLLDRFISVYSDMSAAIDWASNTINSGNGFKMYGPGTNKYYRVSTLETAFYGWVQDGYSKSNQFGGLEQGKIQRNITAAITAGQSLNDTQKETVRRYLFVFEEYYKSAAAILNKITQILEKMAQAIAR